MMSPGSPSCRGMSVPPSRCDVELVGIRNPALARVHPVSPEQSSPTVDPQEFFWPPPREHPVSGPPPSVPPPHTYGRPTVPSPAASPRVTASVGAVMLFPAAAGSTVGPAGIVTATPPDSTASPFGAGALSAAHSL